MEEEEELRLQLALEEEAVREAAVVSSRGGDSTR